MQINILDNGNIYNLALLLQLEGNDVKFYNPDSRTRTILFKNIIKPAPLFALNKNEITLIGLRGKNRHYPQFKKVIGGNRVAERLELSREDGLKLAKIIGFRIPSTNTFSNIKDAIKFLSKQKETYVLKLDENYSSETSLTPNNNEEIIKYLESLPKNIPNIILQKKIKGLEISTEAWFSEDGSILNVNHTIEQKKLLDNNKGPTTGCACTDAVWNVPDWQGDRIGKYFLKLQPFIKKIKYIGPWDFNCIIEDKTGIPYFLEHTPALGYSAIFAWIQLLLEDFSTVLRKLFENKPITAREDKIGYAVRIWKHPYPLELQNEKEHIKLFQDLTHGEIIGKESDLLPACRNVFLFDVYRDKDNICIAGTDGIIAEIAESDNLYNPRYNKWLSYLKYFKNSTLGYRQDVGSRFKRSLNKLKEYNLI